MSFTLSEIIPRVTARLNDSAQVVFTNFILLPFCQDACDILQNRLQLHGVPVLEKKSTAINVTAGTKNLGSSLPTDLLVPQRLEERLDGSTDLFRPMTRREWEPNILPADSLRYWTWREQDIYFVGATQDREVMVYYLKLLLNTTAISDSITVFNSKMFLITRIAALGAKFVANNDILYSELLKESEFHLDEIIRIATKSKQGARTRRKPFVLRGYRRI